MAEDDIRDLAELEAALREHYEQDASSVDFEPLSAAGLAAPARMNRGWGRWLGIAAACIALVVTGALVVPRLLADRPVTATPAPATPVPTSGPTSPVTGSPTPSSGSAWGWVERPDLPSHGVLLASAYAAATVDGVDYYIAEPGTGAEACPPLRGYSYVRATAVWEELPISEELSGDLCQVEGVYPGDGAVHVKLVGRAGPADASYKVTRWLAYRPDARSWQRLPDAPGDPGEFEFGSCTGLDTGIFCYAYDTEVGRFTGNYEVLDFASGAWRLSHSDDLAGLTMDGRLDFSGVRVDGRALVLVVDYRQIRDTERGDVTVSLFDPETGTMTLRSSRELADTPRQVADPGVLYFGPEGVLTDGNEATLLDLRSGRWWSIEVPAKAARPTDSSALYHHPRSAEWAQRVYGDQVAGYVVIRDYLYDPTADRWLALPVIDVSPPWLELPEAATVDEGDPFDELWVGSSPRQCAWQQLGPCYELQAGPLDQVAQELTHDQVMDRPTNVR